MHQKQRGNMRKIIVIIGLISIIFLFWYFGLGQYFTLTAIQQESKSLKDLVCRYHFSSVLTYIIGYAIIIAFGIPAVAPLTILGGFLFGAFIGGFYSLIGATIGSIIYFLLIRYVLGGMIRKRYLHQLEKFNQQIKKYGHNYLLTMHLLTIFPYFVINTLAALADISLSTFTWTTIVGSTPILFIYAFAGRELCMIKSLKDVLQPHFIIMLLLLALLALLPILIRKFRVTIEP